MRSLLKIYRVQISERISSTQIWYHKHKGEVFYCYLWAKHTSVGLRPVFRICDFVDGKATPTLTVLDIKPNECNVMAEYLCVTSTDLYNNE